MSSERDSITEFEKFKKAQLRLEGSGKRAIEASNESLLRIDKEISDLKLEMETREGNQVEEILEKIKKLVERRKQIIGNRGSIAA